MTSCDLNKGCKEKYGGFIPSLKLLKGKNAEELD